MSAQMGRAASEPRARSELGAMLKVSIPFSVHFLFFWKNISRCKCCELLDIGVSGCDQQGDEFASFASQDVAVRPWYLSDQTVGP